MILGTTPDFATGFLQDKHPQNATTETLKMQQEPPPPNQICHNAPTCTTAQCSGRKKT